MVRAQAGCGRGAQQAGLVRGAGGEPAAGAGRR